MRESFRQIAVLLLLIAALLAAPWASAKEDDTEDLGPLLSDTYVRAHEDEMNQLLRKARTAARDGDFEKAAPLFQDAAEKATDQVVRVAPRTFLGVREYVKGQLRAWPEEGIAAYRKMADSRAEAFYRFAIERGDTRGLTQIARRFVMSSWGPKALLALGTRALARGDADGALGRFLEVLQLYPEGEIPGVRREDVLARSGLAAAKQGDRLLLLEMRAHADRLPEDAQVTVAGASMPLRVFLSSLTPTAPGETAPPGWTTPGATPSRAGGRSGPDGPLYLYWAWEIPESAAEDILTEERPHSPILPVHPLIVDGQVIVAGHRMVKSIRLPPDDFDPEKDAIDGLLPEEIFTFPDPLIPDDHGEENSKPGQPPAPATAFGGLLAFPFHDTENVWGLSTDSLLPKVALVTLSLKEQGKVVVLDQRGGVDIAFRDLFESVEFCGAPLVLGDRLYSAGTRWEPGRGLETLVYCFDLSPGRGILRPLWNTFVCQGTTRPAPFLSNDTERIDASSLSSRNGLIYVCSNTGAVAALDADTGDMIWVQTYEQADPNPLVFTREFRTLRTWFVNPPMLDHRFLYVAPLDADSLFVYFQRPDIETGLLLHDSFGREDVEAGFDPEYLIGVRDGLVFIGGTSRNRAEPPLFAVKHGPEDPGDPTRILWRAAIEEDAPRGRGVVAGDAIFFPTKKGIYRVAVADGAVTRLVDPGEDRIRELARGREVIGNLAVSGRWLVSASEELVCLFGPPPPKPPEKEEEERDD